MILFGKDESLLELAHLEGARKAAEFVNDRSDYQPADETILESLQFLGSPELFQALLKRLNSGITLTDCLVLQIVEKIVESGMVKALPILMNHLTEEQIVPTLQFAWDSSLEAHRLRIALWLFENYTEMFTELITSNEVMCSYIIAFTEMPNVELSQWLVREAILPDDDHGDTLVFELLMLILQKQVDQRVFIRTASKYKHAYRLHGQRLELLIALIENGGPIDLLSIVIGEVSDASRLWLSFVEEKEINWRLVEHGRLDMLVEIVRTEFATDTEERNKERIQNALTAVRKDWSTFRNMGTLFNSDIGAWLRRYMEENDMLAVRLIPMLGLCSLKDPLGQAAFHIAWSIVWDRGIFIAFLVQNTL